MWLLQDLCVKTHYFVPLLLTTSFQQMTNNMISGTPKSVNPKRVNPNFGFTLFGFTLQGYIQKGRQYIQNTKRRRGRAARPRRGSCRRLVFWSSWYIFVYLGYIWWLPKLAIHLYSSLYLGTLF